MSSSQWPYTGHVADWTDEVATAVHRELHRRLRANFEVRDSVLNDPAGCDRWLYERLCEESVQLEAAIAEARERDSVARAAAHDHWRQQQLADDAAWRRRNLLQGLLDDARWGLLSLAWREESPRIQSQLKWVAEAASVEQADARALVVHEVVCMPTQLWEPHAASGDWRAALDAWYAACRQLSDWYVCFMRENRTASPAAAHIWAQSDAQTARHAQFTLDQLHASYEAGLTAGGVGDGWRDRYRARLAQAPEDSSQLVTAILQLVDNEPECLEKLPVYWIA